MERGLNLYSASNTTEVMSPSAGAFWVGDVPSYTHGQILYSAATEDVFMNIDEADSLYLTQLIAEMNQRLSDTPAWQRYGGPLFTEPIKVSFLDEIKRILEYE